jgi:hypothetical protein
MKILAVGALVGFAISLGLSCVTSGGGGGGGGGACDNNDYAFPECCSVPDHRPCRGFGEAACRATAYCIAVEGTSLKDHSPPTFYLGCKSACGTYDPASVGMYDPADPSVCYWTITGYIPDGWVEFEPSHPAPGTCGQ